MGLVEHERYYVKIKELNLLLAGLEVPCIYGIASDEEAIPEKEKLNRVLIELYQKQIIDWEEVGIAVKQPYANILEVLLKSKRCVVIKGGSGEYSNYCCYLTDVSVVMTERSQRENGMLCISNVTYPEWLSVIEEYLDMERKYADIEKKMQLEMRNSRNGELYKRITLEERGLQTILIEETGSKEEQIVYDKEVFAQKLEKWWEAEE